MTLCAWTLKSLMHTEGRQVSSIFPTTTLLCGCVVGGLEFLPSKLKLTCLRGFRLERAVLGIAASVSGNVLSCYCSVAALKVCRNCAESKKRHVCSSWCQWNSAFSPQCSTGAGDTSQFLRWCIAWGQTRPQWRRSISHHSLVILRQGWNDRCCFCLKVKVQKSTLMNRLFFLFFLFDLVIWVLEFSPCNSHNISYKIFNALAALETSSTSTTLQRERHGHVFFVAGDQLGRADQAPMMETGCF